MNKKIVSVFLALFIFFSVSLDSFSYADNLDDFGYSPLVFDGGVITGPMVATIVTLGVGAGLIINNQDDIVALGNAFYQENKEVWDTVDLLFKTSVSVGVNGLIEVGKDFKDLVLDTFDSIFFSTGDSSIQSEILSFNPNQYIKYKPLSSYGLSTSKENYKYFPTGLTCEVSPSYNAPYLKGPLYICVGYRPSLRYWFYGVAVSTSQGMKDFVFGVPYGDGDKEISYCLYNRGDGVYSTTYDSTNRFVFPYMSSSVTGVYAPGNLRDKDNVSIYVPGKVTDLVGGNYGDKVIHDGVFAPPYDLPVGGVVDIPNDFVNNDIVIDGSVSFPLNPSVDVPVSPPIDVPVETPLDVVTDWIVSLVVPSDTYWIDKFNHFRNVFLGKFPGLDMTPLEQIACGETPFPNIDVEIMGTKLSRILDSDRTINKVVSFFRPLLQGFISIFLLLYAYKEIYFLVRGVQPFNSGNAGGVIK